MVFLNDYKEISEVLKAIFHGFFGADIGSFTIFYSSTKMYMADSIIIESFVQRATECLNPNKNVGPDGLFP